MRRLTGSEPLFAKSGGRSGRGVTLDQHTRDVMAAAEALFGAPDRPTPLCSQWCDFFGLAQDARPDFAKAVRLAAFCHDWGKANDGFQKMLQGRGEQLLRHEQVSGVIMCWPSIWHWLEQAGCDLPIVLAAVVGHHLKATAAEFDKPRAELRPLRLLWSEPCLQGFLTASARDLKLMGEVPKDLPPRCEYGGGAGSVDLYGLIDRVLDRLEDLDRDVRHDSRESRRRMLWAVRAALVAADACGSGLPREGLDIASWTARCMTFDGERRSPDGRMTGETIRRLIIEPRIETIRSRGRWEGLNAFQRACGDAAAVPERSLLMAPCGTGKTLAAWNWIATRLDERPRARAIFLYPTRGTATEGYHDYAGLAGDNVAALMHGTADLDLDDVAGDLPEEERIRSARLFALRQWDKRIFSATADQFLAFMQHGYAATCQLPLLADSALVLDEVHSYDRGMWSALVEFLRSFPRLPVLCMTATLLPARVRDLEALGIRTVDGIALEAGDRSTFRLAADHGRYRVSSVPDRESARPIVEEALAEGRRVLWVVNTVDRCQAEVIRLAADAAADRLTTATGIPLYCYHSRFRLCDRRAWHAAVVDAFRPGAAAGGVLAVTTQVCEMSLDLDADLLVTEECPATALVQRMGRCCRDPRAHVTGRVGDVVIYPPERREPYAKADLEGGRGLVEAMSRSGLVSQQRLAELLDSVAPPVELLKTCRFTDSGAWAASGEEQFRDSDDLTRPTLLPEDLDEYARLRDPRRRGNDAPWRADGLILTVPKVNARPHGRTDVPKWMTMATGGTYRTATGFRRGEVRSFVTV